MTTTITAQQMLNALDGTTWERMAEVALKVKDTDPERWAAFVRDVGGIVWDRVHVDCRETCVCQKGARA